MKLHEAVEILKNENPFLKALPLSSPLWKKAVLGFFDAKELKHEIKKALITTAANMEDEDVLKRYFDFFYADSDDNIRKWMVEALRDNVQERAVELQFGLMGIREKVVDRYVRQVVSQNITNGIKYFLEKKPIRAGLLIAKLRNTCLNDQNTFVRMNAAIILRNVGDKRALPELEKRLIAEKKLFSQSPDDVGIPYVIRELERSIVFFKERA